MTFPTKFSNIQSILDISHYGRTIIRVSVNPQEIISQIEFGTSNLSSRIKAINQLREAGYRVGILIAPVIFIEGWENLYLKLLDTLEQNLTLKVKEQLFIEIIFMTYSYVHRAINEQAFPNAIELYQKDFMTGRGRGKYCYKNEIRTKGEAFFRSEVEKRFSKSSILYIV